MTDAEIREQTDAFVALPRAERREKYNALPVEVRKKVRRVLEARRGIAFRQDGVPVLTVEAYLTQILRVKTKLDDLPRKEEVLKSKLVELKKQLQENYGDDALAKAEEALEASDDDAGEVAGDNQ